MTWGKDKTETSTYRYDLEADVDVELFEMPESIKEKIAKLSPEDFKK